MRPSCGTRFSEMSSRLITLIRDATLSLIASGGCATSDQDAVDAVADAEELLVRLEVDVGGALAIASSQQLLDVLDDRRVLDVGVVLDRRRPAAAPSSRPTSMSSRFAMSLSVAPLASTSLAMACAELVVLDDDRLGHEVGLEPDLVERLQVGGIGDRDEELVAALVQRQNAPRLRDLEVDVVLLDLVEVEAREVEQRRCRTRATRTPRAADAVIRLPSSTCSTNETPADCACVCSVSASYSDMSAAAARGRARVR